MKSNSRSTQQDQDKHPDDELAERPELMSDADDDRSSGPEDAVEPETTVVGRLRGRLWPASRRGKGLVVAMVISLLAAAGGGYYWLQRDKLPDNAAFRVGERVVTVDELNKNVDTLRALYGVQAPRDPEKLDRFRRDSAKAVAVSTVLDDVAKRQDVVIADKTARDVLTRYVTQQFGPGPDSRAKFVRALGNVGTTEEAVLTEIKRQLAITQLFDDVTAGVTVSDDEVNSAFSERKEELATPERRKIRNIVVRSKEEADQVVQRLDKREEFAAIAREKSIDDSTRAKGGDLGEVTKSQLDGEYAEVAFSAEVGTVFGPVKNDYGWNVGQIERSLPPQDAELEKVRDSLKSTLIMEKATALWRDWLSTQIRDANVRYADDYRPERPEEAPGGPPGQPALPGQETRAPGG